MNGDFEWYDMGAGDYSPTYPDYSSSNWMSDAGDWLGGAANSIWQGFSSPNTWKSLIPMGLTALSAFSQPKQPTPRWTTPPVSPEMNAIGQQYTQLANTPLFSNADVEDQLRQLQGIQAQRGLGTVGSGSWNKMLGELMQRNTAAQKQYQANMLGGAAGVYGRYMPQSYVQQPQNPWYANAAQTYTNLANAANMTRAINPTAGYSWMPWSNMGV